MMTDMCQAGGGGDDVLGGMIVGGIDNASGVGDTVHAIVQEISTEEANSSNTNSRELRENKTRTQRPRHREKGSRKREMREEDKRTGEGKKNTV